MDEELSDYLNLRAEKFGLSATKRTLSFMDYAIIAWAHNNND